MIDDSVIDASSDETKKSAPKAKKLYELMHQLADGFGRKREGAIDEVNCGIMFSTNFPPPPIADTANSRRVLVNVFDAKPTDALSVGPEALENLKGMCDKLLLILPVLLASIRYDVAEIERLLTSCIGTLVHIDLRQWYACWLFFTIEFARVVLECQKRRCGSVFVQVFWNQLH